MKEMGLMNYFKILYYIFKILFSAIMVDGIIIEGEEFIFIYYAWTWIFLNNKQTPLYIKNGYFEYCTNSNTRININYILDFHKLTFRMYNQFHFTMGSSDARNSNTGDMPHIY